MDRTQLQQLGLSPNDVTTDLLVSTAGTTQTSPAFWLSPTNGVVYNLVVQSPQYAIDSLDALLRTPVRAAAAAATEPPQLLSNLVGVAPAVQARGRLALQHRRRRSISTSSAQGRDMGERRRSEIRQLVDELAAQAAARRDRRRRAARCKPCSPRSSSWASGLVMAVVMVYLLIVVNFQSWVDAFIIITALPAALAGICWMLFLTGTTLSVPALTGAIMTMGVATANSILVVSFARQRMGEGLDPVKAALDAGATRIRPVLDDGAGDDHRHDSHGAWLGRGCRAECAPGPRGDRRPAVRDRLDAAFSCR